MAENIQVIKSSGQEVYLEGENVTQQADVAANDSDKTFTVPAGKSWILQFLSAVLVTTATPGNRQLSIEIGDGTNVLWAKDFGAVQADSVTRNYYAASDHPDDAAFDASDRIRMQLEAHVLPAGYTVRIFDSAAIDPTADDLTIRFIIDERNAGAML